MATFSPVFLHVDSAVTNSTRTDATDLGRCAAHRLCRGQTLLFAGFNVLNAPIELSSGVSANARSYTI